MRLVNADEFKEQLKQRYMKAVEWKSKTVYYERADGAIATYLEAIRTLNSAPTVDASPRVKGKWIRNSNGTYSCNLCQSWIPNEQRHYANYCLFCGADMKEERKDDSN